MKLSEFDFSLPPDRIAQEPSARRDASRLMVLDRTGSQPSQDRVVTDLPTLLDPGDLLVINDTRVVPSRLVGVKATGGKVDLLLLDPVAEGDTWNCLIRASRSPKPGTRLRFEGLAGEVLERSAECWRVRFDRVIDTALLDRIGLMPLPPYIARHADDPRASSDRSRYQTVYAKVPGAVAAPTAGLHFTTDLLSVLERQGIEIARITLHVGAGTFQPVREDDPVRHLMQSERIDVPGETVDAVGRTREAGKRVVAVGTTVTRALESRVDPRGRLSAGSGWTGLFILPGYRFRAIDALITNFHLPRSTLLMLVCAFGGRTAVLEAYRRAIETGYRFYSYGDAMLLR